MDEVNYISDLRADIEDFLKSQVTNGYDQVDTHEMGEVVDIIKDLAQAEKYLREACYYKTVVEAMNSDDSELKSSVTRHLIDRMDT